MVINDMAEHGGWFSRFTKDRCQLSNDGSMAYVKGTYKESIMNFTSAEEMRSWCYGNGWSDPEQEAI